MIRFTVYGVPVQKGSMKSFTYQLKNKATGQPILDKQGKPIYRAAITHENPRSKNWQQLVAEAASRALTAEGQVYLGAVRLEVAFFLPRPKSIGRRDVAMTKKPDASKLLRSTEDALTGVLFRDDSQVVDVHVTKRYAAFGESPRAIVVVEPLDAAERMFADAQPKTIERRQETEGGQLSLHPPGE
jgi:Holliday junction resolvase RusA-like endonuclease